MLDFRGVEKKAKNDDITVYTSTTQKLERINEQSGAVCSNKDNDCMKMVTKVDIKSC